MTDTQLLTVAITLLAIFIAMLVNNQRMSDLRTDVGLRIGDVGTRFGDVDTEGATHGEAHHRHAFAPRR